MKLNLILVHSFPTNSVLLNGLREFLSDYFVVHFIDLPGFHPSIHPLRDKITIQRFSNYFDKKVAELEVDEYIVGGVSFGFLVVNNARLDKRCKGILAMEPYLNTDCLNISYSKMKLYSLISKVMTLVHMLGAENLIWHSNWFNRYLQTNSGYPKKRIDTIVKHIDPRTFFAVASILFNYHKEPRFHPLPYFLVGNFADTTIDFDTVVEIFIKNLHELHITSEPIDHYPKNLTKDYFKTRIPKEHIERMLACIDGVD